MKNPGFVKGGLSAAFLIVTQLTLSVGTLRAQLTDTLAVFAVSTTSVYSVPLLNNVDYDIICSGTYSLWKDANGDSVGLVDAAYFIDIPEGEFGNGLEPLPTNTSNGFLIDGVTVIARIGSPGVSPVNRYVIPFRGNGNRVEFFIADRPPFSVDRHGDNTGALRVEIHRISPKVSTNTRRIDFGDVLLGMSRDSSVVFHNSARSGLQVNLSSIAGTHATDFSILGSAGFTIYQDQDSSVFIRFTPQAAGKRYATLIFNTNDPVEPEVRVELEGNGVAPMISLSPAILDFGEVELGAYRDTTIEVLNPGTAPLTVDLIAVTGNNPADFAVTASVPFTVGGGMSRQITLRFAPLRIGTRSAELEVSSNASATPAIIPLSGLGVTTLTAGFAPAHRGRAEEVVTIPVEVFENRNGSDVTSYHCLVHYNYRILYPRRVLTSGTLSNSFNLQWDLQAPGILKVEASNGGPLSGVGTLFNLECLILFGDTAIAPLRLDSLRFNDGNPRARVRDGLFFRDSACNQYLRQVVEIGTVQLRQNVPNPISAGGGSAYGGNATTRIAFSLPSAQHVRLDLVDRMGRIVAVLADGLFEEGEHNLTYTARGQSSGTYYYRLRTTDRVLVRRMVIVR